MKKNFTFLLTALFLCVGMTMKAQTFPETSTAEAPKYYTIASYNRGGVLTDVGGALQHVAVAGGSYWYFTKANDNGGVYFCNSNGRYLTANQTVGDTPGVWYVLANGVNTEGVSISKTNPISNGSCLDASNAGAGVGTWAPSANDWHGTTWVFAEAEGIEKLSYTLTDELGNKYTGSYIGVAGTSEPTLSGAVGCTFSNVAWNGTTYTASIVFPFRVSDANTTKGVMISSFKNDANKFLWRAVGTNITGQKSVEADSENYHWAIYPAFNDGSFTFTIKNIGTGKYIYSTSDANSHNQGAVVLADEGSAFTLEANNKFKLSTGKFLSMNSTTTANEQYVGTWGDHGGTYNKFYDCPVKVTVESPWVGNIIENGNTYYLYNAKAKAFMKGANSWGTQASFGEDAVAFTAEGSGDTYGLRSTYNNYLGADLYVDQGKKDFVFTQVGDGIYTITKDGAYLAYIDNSVVKTVAEVTDGCYWQLLTKESILSDMTAATVSSPYGVTPLITGANFGRNDNANSAWSGGPAVGGDNANHCAEKWNAGVFTVSQELANLPSGTYKLQAQGFYRMGGVAEAAAARAAGTEVYDVKFIANDQSVTLMSVMDEAGKLNVGADYGSYGKAPNSMGDASQFFSNGYYEHELYFSVGDDGQAVIGVNHNEAIGNDWVIFDNFRLTYYGDLSLSDFNKQAFYVVKDQLDDLVNTCSSLSTLNAVFAAYSDVVDGAEVIANDEGATLEEIEAFIPVMEAMIAQVKAIDEYYNNVFVPSLESYNEILMKSTPNSQDVYEAFNDAISAASNVSSVTAIAELEAKVAAMENARKVYVLNAIPTDDCVFDYTFLLVNPDMETGNINGWTHTDGWQFQSNNEFKNGDAVINRKFQERWVWAAALGNVSTEQTVSDIPNGVYSVSASIIATRQDAADPKAAATGVYLFANTSKVAAATANNVPELFTVEVNVLNNVLTLGVKGENAEANWIAFDNVTLSYHGALPESVILQLQKEEFLAKWEEYKAYEPSLNGSWGAINNTYYKAVYDSADAMVKDLDAVTEKTVIEEMITKMSEAIASVEAAYVVGVEHSKLTAVLEDALANSIPLNASVLEAANDALQTAKNAGTSIATTEALEQAIEDLTTAYITYISNAVAKEEYAFDITCLVVNAEVTSAEGWTNAEGRIITNTTYEGAPDKAAFDAGWWAGVVDIHQVLPELPAGGYTLSAVARSASPESYIYAKNGDVEVKTTLPQDGDQNGQFGNGWGKVSTDTINVAAGESLTIGVHINNPGTNFAAADNFKLYYIPAYVKATKVVLNKAKVVLTAQGATEQLVATVEPANATFNTVTWKSSNEAAVTVDANGVVTAVANGTATISATTADGATATCQVTVAIAVSEVKLDKSEATLTAKDATLALNVTVLPEDAADKTVTWSTSDENVATVDANGVVTAVANGKATITATAGGFSATCEVTVAIAVTEVSLDKSEATLTAKDATLALNVTVLPEDAADKTVTWSTSDENVATVDANGVVTAVANGTATITATAGGFSATCEVTVAIYVEVAEIFITPTWGELTEVGQTLQLTATINPEDATDKTLVWSSDVDFVTVDENGLVTVVAPGEGMVTITATASNGVSGSCYLSVFVEDPNAITVTLNKWVLDFEYVGETFQLVATVTPEDMTGYVVTFSSSDETVATVDENGLITSVGKGEADITVYVNGVEYATCWVEVLSDTPVGIENIDSDVNAVIYDLSGRRVTEMTEGIYIVNGKRVIKK